jgi:hypothetical protein
VPFGVVGKILIDEHYLMEFIYLVRFWIQNVGDIDFKVIFAPENSIKFPKKPGFGRKKSVENVVTLEGLHPFNSSMISFHIWLFKKNST